MYGLMALLSILATGCFLRAFVLRDRRFVPRLRRRARGDALHPQLGASSSPPPR